MNILLNLDGVLLDRVSEFRFLGVIIDDKAMESSYRPGKIKIE